MSNQGTLLKLSTFTSYPYGRDNFHRAQDSVSPFRGWPDQLKQYQIIETHEIIAIFNYKKLIIS